MHAYAGLKCATINEGVILIFNSLFTVGGNYENGYLMDLNGNEVRMHTWYRQGIYVLVRNMPIVQVRINRSTHHNSRYMVHLE